MNADPNQFEQQLRNALRRKSAPEGFEARVLAARAEAMASREAPRRRWFPAWAAAVMAAVLIVSVGTWERQREIRERAAGEAAKARLELALRIAGAKLRKIQRDLEAVE